MFKVWHVPFWILLRSADVKTPMVVNFSASNDKRSVKFASVNENSLHAAFDNNDCLFTFWANSEWSCERHTGLFAICVYSSVFYSLMWTHLKVKQMMFFTYYKDSIIATDSAEWYYCDCCILPKVYSFIIAPTNSETAARKNGQWYVNNSSRCATSRQFIHLLRIENTSPSTLWLWFQST